MPKAASSFSRRVVYSYLEKYFGFQEFRPGQAEVIRSILTGNESVAVLPTGGGKSLCYQLPAILLPGTTLVISPLIALMRDQVLALHKLGIPAASLDSSQSLSEREAVEQAFAEGRLKLLYVSPERLTSQRFLDLLQLVEVPFVAVDEVHCVLRWGHEFREAYLGIKDFLETLKPERIGGFTATATPQLRTELAEALGLKNPDVYVRGFFRSNLNLKVEKAVSADARLARMVNAVKARSGKAPALIYATTRQATEDAVETLRHAGLKASFYHGGCAPDHRMEVQDAFIADEIDALVATNAFGMGIDKPDIRLLIHLSLPRSFEDYYQEVGRAGRDGEDSTALMIWRGTDYRTHTFLIEQQPEPRYREAASRRLTRIYETLRGSRCLWLRILEYFGDPDASDLAAGCNACDRCANGGVTAQTLTGDSHTQAMAILATVRQMDGRYGRGKILKILKGSKAKGIPDWPQSFGVLSAVSMPQLDMLAQGLLDSGYLAVVGSEYPMLGLGPQAESALAEEAAIEVILPEVPAGRSPVVSTSVVGTSVASKEMLEGDGDPVLLEKLKVWRRAQAEERGVPAFCILSNRSLEGVAITQPGCEEDLLAVHGIGPAKHEEFGPDLLDLVRTHLD
ncbi:MAG: hypothetical protein COA70_07800 [Planctomycetota bacterium]|nr:MAG: hypothetical protein COA70_07800 [Planctomycetota bacterium]